MTATSALIGALCFFLSGFLLGRTCVRHDADIAYHRGWLDGYSRIHRPTGWRGK